MKTTYCPFCGNYPDPPEPHEYRFAVYCPTCEYWGPTGQTPALAVNAWNCRSYPYKDEVERLTAELEELKEVRRCKQDFIKISA